MGRNKEPIKLIQAKNRKHLTKSEISQRENTELPVIADNIKPPDFLSDDEKAKFRQFAIANIPRWNEFFCKIQFSCGLLKKKDVYTLIAER